MYKVYGYGVRELAVLSNYLFFVLLYNYLRPVFYIVYLYFAALTTYAFVSWYITWDFNEYALLALFQTNTQEFTEYVTSLPLELYVKATSIFILQLVVIYFGWLHASNQSKTGGKVLLFSRKRSLIFILVSLLIIVYSVVGKINKLPGKFSEPKNLELTQVYTISMLVKSYNMYKGFTSMIQQIDAYKTKPSWEIASVNPKYKTYVIVLGESARKDFFSAYNFPLNTSPFLNQVKGTIYNGYVSYASSTPVSIHYSFYYYNKAKGKTELENNVINLAKSAGFNTAWISAQARFSQWDTSATLLSKFADYSWFRTSHYVHSVFDKDLLPIFDQYLTQTDSEDKPRIIVLHTNGSHPYPCHRLYQDVTFNYINKSLSCYVQTIRQTDDFLAQVTQIIQKHTDSYSLMYFSDHGLMISNLEDKEKTYIHHAATSKQNFDIPLVVINSDDQEHKVVNFRQINLNFLAGFSQWTGISYKQVSLPDFWKGTTEPLILAKQYTIRDYNALIDNPAPTNNITSNKK
ncbi:phosphoethanolamine transferase [Psittacicella hinzii]